MACNILIYSINIKHSYKSTFFTNIQNSYIQTQFVMMSVKKTIKGSLTGH